MVTVYISPTGNDTTGSGTSGNPYQTLSKAFSVSGLSPGGTVFLFGGTYPSTTQTSANGLVNVTIASVAGQLAILNGGGGTADSILLLTSSSGCVIQGIQFQNNVGTLYGALRLQQCQNISLIANCFSGCYTAVYMLQASWCTISGNLFSNTTSKALSLNSGCNNNTIDSNEIDTITLVTGTGTQDAGVKIVGGSRNQITHNVIKNCAGSAIVISAFNTGSYAIGNIIQYNYCPNNCTSASATDCGVIYIDNQVKMLNNQTLIDNNYAAVGGNSGSATIQNVGIYLDDFTSGCTVTNNIIVKGQKGFQIHGGMNNIIQNNIIDMAASNQSFNAAGFIQGEGGFGGGNMNNNLVSGNIIYSTSATAPVNVWSALSFGVANIYANFYWNTQSVTMLNSGYAYDTGPIVENPAFWGYANGIYDMDGSSACIRDGFIPINQGLMALAPKTAHFY